MSAYVIFDVEIQDDNVDAEAAQHHFGLDQISNLCFGRNMIVRGRFLEGKN